VGKMFINGKLYPVIGKVCMDMTMVDITDSDIKVGDPVEIFGSNIKIIDFAKNCKTTCYEVLTRLSSRIDRIPISNQK
jgi:alanine racemase